MVTAELLTEPRPEVGIVTGNEPKPLGGSNSLQALDMAEGLRAAGRSRHEARVKAPGWVA